MKRVPIVLLMLLLVAACGFATWFVLQEVDPGSAAPGGTTPTGETPAAGPVSPADTASEEGGRHRVDEPTRAGRGQTDFVRGLVTHGSVGVAGATIEAFAAPPGDVDEKLALARSIFGDAFSDAELKQMDSRFSSLSGGQADPEAAMDAMNSGREMIGRILSNPTMLEKALEFARIEQAGFESDAAWPRVGAATTDGEGRFAIEKLPAGRVELRVRAPGYRRVKQTVDVGDTDVGITLTQGAVLVGVVTSEGRAVAGATVRTKTTTISADGAGNFRVDGAVTPTESLLVSAPGFVSAGLSVPLSVDAETPPVTVELTPAATVRGVVLARSGAPVEGATVRPTQGGGFNPMMFLQLAQKGNVAAPTPTARTDADGRFELGGVPAVSTALRAEKTGYLAASTEALPLALGAPYEDVELVLVAESVVTGRVTAPDGASVSGAKVKVELPAPGGLGAMVAGMFGGSWAQGLTDDQGEYRVGGLPGGERKVRVESAHFLHDEGVVTVPEEGRVAHDVRLQPGHTLTGSVVGPGGAPVAGATVSVSWPDPAGAANPMMSMLGMGGGADATATTDADGRFSFEGLQAGPYEVKASGTAFLEANLADVAQGTADVVLQLRAAAAISGVALDASGAPLGGVAIHRKGGPRPRGGGNPMMAMFRQDQEETTDARGRFTHGGLEPGEYTLFGRRNGYADSAELKIKVGEGEVVEGVELVLGDGVTLSGRVVSKGTGEPIVDAVVYVPAGTGPLAGFNPMEAIDGPPQAPDGAANTRTDANGAFELQGLTPGTVTVEVRAESRAPASMAQVEVPGSGIVVEMGVGGTVEGQVLDESGTAVAGVQIILSGGAMGFGRQRVAQTDATGLYRMERIVPGTYQIMKMDSSSAFGVGGINAVTVKEGETVRKDFRPDTTGGRVSGKVMRGGAPVSGAMVMLTGGSAGLKMSTTGDDGAFTFDSLDAGDYTVSVQADLMGGGTSSQTVKVAKGARVGGVRIELSSLSVSGRVVDAETGEGVAMAQVILSDASAGAAGSLSDIMASQRGQAFTDPQGRFTLKGVEAGPFSMRISASGYAEQTRENVGAGADIEVRLTKGVEFAVTVLGPDGAPLQGATVVTRDSAGRETVAFSMSMQGVTDARGIATLRLGPGRYVLVAETAELPAAEVEVDAVAGAATVRLQQGGALEIVVTRAGRPVPGLRALVLDAAGNPIQKRISIGNVLGSGGVTDASGRLLREGLPAGAVTVVVNPPDGEPVRRAATVRRGATERVEIDY